MPAEDITLTANFDLVISAGYIISGETELFPNPFSGSLTVSNASGISRIVFADMSGTIIMDRRLDGSEMHAIDTTALRSGLYLVVLYDREGRKEIRRMIKID
jgi:trimeric autotransporter adhesin